MNHAKRKFAPSVSLWPYHAGREASFRYGTLGVASGRQVQIGSCLPSAQEQGLANTVTSCLRSAWRFRSRQSLQPWSTLRYPMPVAFAVGCGVGAGLLSLWPDHGSRSHCQAIHPTHTAQPQSQPGALSQLAFVLHMCFRTALLLSILFPLLLTYPLANLHPFGRSAWLQLLRHSLKYCGPAWAKWGQWASARPDLLPSDIRQVLETLHTAVPPHSAAASRAVLQNSLALPLDEIFERIEWEPVASGAIAQVHRAWLTPGAAQLCGASPGEVRRSMPAMSPRPPWPPLVHFPLVVIDLAANYAARASSAEEPGIRLPASAAALPTRYRAVLAPPRACAPPILLQPNPASAYPASGALRLCMHWCR